MSLASVQLAKVIGVTTTGNITHGIVLGGTNSVLQGNFAAQNGSIGISMSGGSKNTIANNFLTNNTVGIDLAFSNLNNISANVASFNTSTGISIRGTQNDIHGNLAFGNGFVDMSDHTTLESNCDGNRWRGNQFDTADQLCIH